MFPGRRSRQGRGARHARELGLAGRRQAGQPRDLLRRRRRSRGVPRARRRRSAGAGAIRDAAGAGRRHARRRPSLHRRPAQGPRPLLPRFRSTSSAIDAAANSRSSSVRGRARATELTASGVNWIAGEPPSRALRVDRADPPPPPRGGRDDQPAGRRPRARVTFDQPQSAVAPGQAVVLYDGDVVVGGGWID